MISVDFDGVLADLLSPWLNHINKKHNKSYSAKDVKKYNQDFLANNREFLYIKDLYSKVELYEGSKSFIKELQEIDDVQIVTHSIFESLDSKRDFIKKHFPSIDVIHTSTSDKTRYTNGSTLIEDRKEAFYNHVGTGIIFSNNNKHIYNKVKYDDNFSCEVQRLASYQDILSYLKLCKDLK